MNLLLKFSGEFFSTTDELTKEGFLFLNAIKDLNLTSGYIVVGGGNRIRGKNSSMNRNSSDRLGVISTIFNAFVLQEYFSSIGFNSSVFSHFSNFGFQYSPELAMDVFAQGHWVILAGGLGSVGYISTDLSSVIKSLELNVDALVKVTKVDGIFDRSPDFEGAKIVHKISYEEVSNKKLSFMDAAAIAIAAENELPIGVCSIANFCSFLRGERVGSIVGYDWR